MLCFSFCSASLLIKLSRTVVLVFLFKHIFYERMINLFAVTKRLGISEWIRVIKSGKSTMIQKH